MASINALTIATRESPLAMWQAEFIQRELEKVHSGLAVNLLGMTTRGDQMLDSPLAKVGGKGLFVKELELALLDGRADIAVHSAKDMPAELPDGLALQVAGERETPFDALVLPNNGRSDDVLTLQSLPQGAVVGTSSLRRKCQLLHVRPDLQCRDLRGNVNTRLAKLDAGNFDAIVLAAAGLQRIGLGNRISFLLPASDLLPAVGQGALAIETRVGDDRVNQLLDPLVDFSTQLCVTAERAMNKKLDGGCQVPIAGFAQFDGSVLAMSGRVGAVDGKKMLNASATCEILDQWSTFQKLEAGRILGEQIAADLLAQGAHRYVASAAGES